MSRTILVVDDDPLIRRLIAATLGGVGGFRLREASDGEEALEAAFEDRPEIVLLDYAMPRLDGVETCRRLRSDPVTAGATIVMLTGLSDGPVRDRAAAAGADHFLAKPFSPLRLLRLVDELGAGRG
jgi:CheY-like chemotaxis protein